MASKPLRKAGEVTKTASKGAGSAKNTVQNAKDTATSSLLTEALQGLAGTVAKRAASSATNWVSSATDRLTDYASGEGKSGSLLSALSGNGSGGGSIKRAAAGGAIKSGFSAATQKVTEGVKKMFGGGGGGGPTKGLKLTNIVEHIDVGVDIRLAYDLWTQFTDFPRFMKKVEDVQQAEDEKLNWKAQVFWSHRTWEATILEQVPEKRIVWRSKGQKGSVDGAVTFHELAPDLTRIVVVLEYRPQGLFERTGNLWRAQGRRVRLELKHFQRHAMVHVLLNPDEVEGWRGEIRDGEVVDSQDQEDQPTDRADEDRADEADEEGADEEGADEAEADEYGDEDEAGEEEPEDEYDEDTDTDAGAEQDEPERRARPRRRSTGKATARRGGS